MAEKKYKYDLVAVTPIDKSRFSKGVPQDSISLRWQALMNNTVNEILNKWWPESPCYNNEGQFIDFGYLENNSKKGGFGRETKGGIRTPAEHAFTIAVSVFTGTYDSVITGISERSAIERAVTIIKSIARDHLANEGIGNPWGNMWQTAQWSSKCAIAGWLLWDYLEADAKQDIYRMLEFEANNFLNTIPSSANENYVNDTHAEENAWDASGIQAACAMLPSHPNHDRWLKKSIEYRVNALAAPADAQSSKIIDNQLVKELVTGYNIDSLGALGNHGAYPHPDYMASPLRHVVEGSEYMALGNQKIPEANRFNCNIVYQDFVNHVWNEESTIYKEDGSVYWPIDIEEERRFDFLTFGIIDAGGVYLGYDDLAKIKASYWEDKHTRKAVEMGLTYFTAASAYLLHWLVYQGVEFK